MINKYKNQALELTQKILEQYWQGHQKLLISHMHKNIYWIGSVNEEYLFGKEKVLQRMSENQDEMPMVFLDEQEYTVVQNEGNTCVVAGRYRAYTKPESGILLSERQRITFVWEKEKVEKEEFLFIKHIHLSNVLHIQSEDERFPTQAGKESYEYMQKIMAERSNGNVITVNGEGGVKRVINYSDIMYVKSERNYLRLYLANEQGNLRVRGKISEFMKELPDFFIAVTRSYGINKSYIKYVKGQELVMIDGEKFMIPRRTCADFKHAIQFKKR